MQNNFFINTVFDPTPAAPITVYFKNGQTADYTANIIDLLKTDNAVKFITDGLTGEIIHEND